ncbi:phytoene synthase [Microbacterium sp. CH12i]|uniref:phytoene/squalene synthase family protein n=1 Tax=Microbacterium sp. CH12i TaxID=1479651 RepID=UPI00046116EC|nr:phytoene/squalene synthase family protein [Microbacterium sp. CH12i]KDA05619.1 phytoene synthase [Microbacterium sp. CH12i]
MKLSGLGLYNATANQSASVIIRRYSTSFGWASRLLDHRVRRHIACIYGLVRIADELVDGPAAIAGVDAEMRRTMLDELERETERALRLGFSTNIVVHAFALTAREHDIGMDLCRPFFSAMRTDVESTSFNSSALHDYIYGSAEVVGLMCLAVFEHGRIRDSQEQTQLVDGARRLGAAFQKVNFLRDFAEDHDVLGRVYFAGTEKALTEESKREIIDSIREDLRAADASIPLLTSECRPAVWAARTMFSELTHRLDTTSVAALTHTRVRVPNTVKARILGRAIGMRISR